MVGNQDLSRIILNSGIDSLVVHVHDHVEVQVESRLTEASYVDLDVDVVVDVVVDGFLCFSEAH